MIEGYNRKLVSIFEGITTKLVESQEPNRLYDVAVPFLFLPRNVHTRFCQGSRWGLGNQSLQGLFSMGARFECAGCQAQQYTCFI